MLRKKKIIIMQPRFCEIINQKINCENTDVLLGGADSFKSFKFDCKFQHFSVIIRNVTAKC